MFACLPRDYRGGEAGEQAQPWSAPHGTEVVVAATPISERAIRTGSTLNTPYTGQFRWRIVPSHQMVLQMSVRAFVRMLPQPPDE